MFDNLRQAAHVANTHVTYKYERATVLVPADTLLELLDQHDAVYEAVFKLHTPQLVCKYKGDPLGCMVATQHPCTVCLECDKKYPCPTIEAMVRL